MRRTRDRAGEGGGGGESWTVPGRAKVVVDVQKALWHTRPGRGRNKDGGGACCIWRVDWRYRERTGLELGRRSSSARPQARTAAELLPPSLWHSPPRTSPRRLIPSLMSCCPHLSQSHRGALPGASPLLPHAPCWRPS
ncbi:hypothetical protein GY45DRAFT_986984 [Cubamyces sp. BRFM 1775]|nr:hypothetical protein GY45DRAFT_986984 [Cubamyces sp. BRFM 1775]